MAKGVIQVNGTADLIGKLKRNANMDDVKNVVKLNTSELQRTMQRNAVFTRGYATGTTKRSIGQTLSNNGFTGKVAPTTHYSPYVEYGTRKMSAQPFVRPSFFSQRQQFIKDMQRLMK